MRRAAHQSLPHWPLAALLLLMFVVVTIHPPVPVPPLDQTQPEVVSTIFVHGDVVYLEYRDMLGYVRCVIMTRRQFDTMCDNDKNEHEEHGQYPQTTPDDGK